MADYKLQTRISQELADRLLETIKELQSQTEVADVTISSITRASLERFLKQHEKEKRGIITVDLPLNELTEIELSKLYQFLSSFYSLILERKVNKNNSIKNDNVEYYNNMKDFLTIEDATHKCLMYITQLNLMKENQNEQY